MIGAPGTPFASGRSVEVLFCAVMVVMTLLAFSVPFTTPVQAADRHFAEESVILAQLATRGTTTNSQIPRGPTAGGPSSFGAKTRGIPPKPRGPSSLGAKTTGVTPKPGGSSSVGPSTRTPTTSGPASGRFAISPRDMKRLKPSQGTSNSKKKAVKKRKPSKAKKARVGRPQKQTFRRAASPPVPPFLPDQVVVLVRNQPPSVDETLANEFNLELLASTPIALLEGRVLTYQLTPGQSLQNMIDRLDADQRISTAQTNILYITVQGSKSVKTLPQYALGKLRLDKAHKIAQGTGITIAVIDTGVDRSHPSLANAIQDTYDAVNSGVPNPENHGTGIAAVIAGRGKVRGVAPAANLLTIRAFSMHPKYKRPVTSSAILLRAMDWAFVNKARIFNMSFAGRFDPLLKEALTAASEKGIIHVAAAGNGGSKAPPAYPAAYENVIAITALDRKDRLFSEANQGLYVTAAAPGVDVLVPTLKKGYRYSSGTSFAAAHVSGIVALLLERSPDIGADAVVEVIRNSAHDLGPKGHDAKFGSGRADAYASLMKIAP